MVSTEAFGVITQLDIPLIDFIDFIALLNKQHVDYMIIGAHALAYHGRPRHTADLDIWIKPSIENASKMIFVLRDLALDLWALQKRIF